jgi:hypothetical protein
MIPALSLAWIIKRVLLPNCTIRESPCIVYFSARATKAATVKMKTAINFFMAMLIIEYDILITEFLN